MMKKIIYSLLLFFFSATLLAPSVIASSPQPPEVKSTIGYLLVKKDLEVPPELKRLMIMPHAELIVLNQDINNFILIYQGKVTATCCILPKYAKNMVLLRKSYRKNYISFRGPVEVDTLPFLLYKGEELPIVERRDGFFYVVVTRKGIQIQLALRDDTPGTIFSTESEFAKFTEEQAAKGLVYYNKQWIPKEDAYNLRKIESADKLRKLHIWNNMKRAADLGVVVLKSGAVLNGKIIGSSEDKILFESDKRDYMLGVDDVAPITFSELMARDKIDKALTHLNAAKKERRDDRGRAMFHAEQAMKNLKDISLSAKTEYDAAKHIIAEVASFIDNINSSLTKAGETIYCDTVFPVNTLNYHLKRGDVLLRKKYWLRPEQLCNECHASGKLTCPTCLGKGRLIKDCPACIGGRITCTICHGLGRKKCSYCGGKGYIYVEQKQTSVSASFGSYYGDCGYGRYHPAYGGGRTLYSKGGYMFFQPANYYGGACYGGTSLTVGNQEKTVKKVCPVCHGTGTVSCPKTEKCTQCDGIGYFIEVCPTCKGDKNITCGKCEGKGFLGEPQRDPDIQKSSPVQEYKDSHSYFNAPVLMP